jgi:hypothetical protein
MENLAKISNNYQNELNKIEEEAKTIKKKLGENAKKMQKNLDSLRKILLGDDSRVEEAVLIGFLTSIYSTIQEAYDSYKEMTIKKEETDNQTRKEQLEKNLKDIEEFKKKSEMINKYNKLKVQQSAIEKSNQNPQTTEKQKGLNTQSLKEIYSGMKKIEDYFGFAEDGVKFAEEIEKFELETYGEKAHQMLEDLRNLEPETLLKLEKEGIKLEDIINDEDEELIAKVAEKVREIANLSVEETLEEINNITKEIDSVEKETTEEPTKTKSQDFV